MSDVLAVIREAAQRRGVDPDGLIRTAQIESSLNPNARNPRSSAGGLFQFIDSTARRYGLANRYDPAQAADAAARLWADNSASLRRALGRQPTSAELYLAHQQGAGGAARLLMAGNAPAAQVVGQQAAALNAGAGLTAQQFADRWIGKFNRTPGTVSAPTVPTTNPMGTTGAPPAAASVESVPLGIAAPMAPNPLQMQAQRSQQRRQQEQEQQRQLLSTMFT